MSVFKDKVNEEIMKNTTKSVFTDLYEIIKKQITGIVKEVEIHFSLQKASMKIESIGSMRTLLRPNETLHISDIYFPIKINVRGKLREVETIESINDCKRVVIKGIAGQGKSCLLKMLALSDHYLNKKIPLFMEARLIEDANDLEGMMLKEAWILGLPYSPDLFKRHLQEGYFSLFIDGYDEIDAEKRKKIRTNLRTLARSYPSMKMYMTTRPDYEFSNIEEFEVIEIGKMNKFEAIMFIRKMLLLIETIVDEKYRDSIIKFLNEQNKTHFIEVLNTPLMCVLLIIRYKIDKRIPQNVLSFYRNMFVMFAQWHEIFQRGEPRSSKTGIEEAEMDKLFQLISLHVCVDYQAATRYDNMHSITEHVVKHKKLECSPSDLLSDICNITNLILREGELIVYAHKSIAEYNAAAALSALPDEVAKVFFGQFVDSNESLNKWKLVLVFYKMLNPTMYYALFLLPLLYKWKMMLNIDPVSYLERCVVHKKYNAYSVYRGHEIVEYLRNESIEIDISKYDEKIVTSIQHEEFSSKNIEDINKATMISFHTIYSYSNTKEVICDEIQSLTIGIDILIEKSEKLVYEMRTAGGLKLTDMYKIFKHNVQDGKMH